MMLSVSYNWLREFLPGLKATPDEVAEKLSLHAFSVERWHRMDEGLDPLIVVGKIEKIEAHPKADKLKLAYVQASSQSSVHSSQLLKIVCGGTNLYEGQLVAVALPGARVRWHGEGELVELTPTEIRGVTSEGMICAANEIGLFEMFPHKEREILDLSATGARVGESVAKALGLDDAVFEVEVTTNRPDAMGVMGLAREVGAIFGLKIGRNPPQPPLNLRGGKSGGLLDVRVEVPKLCPRYIAVVMEGVKVAPSPWWVQRRLMASGVRPINNIVDITNYVLLEYGQPCHAFDFEKLGARGQGLGSRKEIVVRMAKKGEKILALDGNPYDLDEKILVIADAQKPVAIAGIMGGEETGVHEGTTRIVYEIANFDPLTVRRGEHQLGLSSDSSVRFNKGLPVQLPGIAAARLMELTKKVVGGEVVGVVDRRSDKAKLFHAQSLALSPQEVVKKIGVEISAAQMKEYLTRLGFKVGGGAKKWSVTFPYWRALEADGTADIAEEVARMYGYHRLPSVLPQGDLPGEALNPQFSQEHAIKEALRGAGFTEVYTYSFVSGDDLARAGADPARDALALANPLTSELTHLRPWLGISVLKAVEHNQKERDALKLFELSAEYHPRGANNESRTNLRISNSEIRKFEIHSQFAPLPDERQKLIVVSAGQEGREGEHFYAIKGAAEHLAELLSLPNFGYEKVGTTKAPWVAHYHPSRILLSKSGRDILGVVGELHPQLLRAFGIEQRVVFLEWEMKVLLPLIGSSRTYTSPPLYPPVKRDIAFIVSKAAEYAKLHRAIVTLDPLITHVELFDQYAGKGVPEGQQSLAFHITYASPERTLTAEEADRVHAKLSMMLREQFHATIRD